MYITFSIAAELLFCYWVFCLLLYKMSHKSDARLQFFNLTAEWCRDSEGGRETERKRSHTCAMCTVLISNHYVRPKKNKTFPGSMRTRFNGFQFRPLKWITQWMWLYFWRWFPRYNQMIASFCDCTNKIKKLNSRIGLCLKGKKMFSTALVHC